MLGSEFVIIDDFKISAGGGKSELIISSIYIGSKLLTGKPINPYSIASQAGIKIFSI
jgi:hypothetical protein